MEPDGDAVELPSASEFAEVIDAHQLDGALMLTFGQVVPGREKLAVSTFVEVSRLLGELVAEGAVEHFSPYFYSEGSVGDVSGFFMIDGDRDRLEAVRRSDRFQTMLVRAGAAVGHVRLHTLVAGSEAGRLVNRYREVRSQLGLI